MNTGEMNDMPMGNIEQQQITTFADDSTLVSGAKPGISNVSSWKSFAEEGRNHGILDILSRPVLLTDSSSIWSTSSAVNARPTASVSNSVFSFPDAILNKSPNIVKKIANFAYFRANVKIRIMVNAQAFSQGKLWIWFSPYELASGTQFSANNLAAKTGYPGVELDVASGVPVEFSIPYCAPQSHYNLVSGEGTMGDLFLTVLSPLTITDASLSVFAWFENIDLQLPTGADRNIIPSPYFSLNSELTINFNDTAITGLTTEGSLLTNGTVFGTLKNAILILSGTNGNLIVLPAGTSVKVSAQGVNPGRYYTVTTNLGLSGGLVRSLSGTNQINFDYPASGTAVLTSSIMSWKMPLNSTLPIYLTLDAGATYTATTCSLPNTFVANVNVPTTSSNYVTCFDFSGSNIYIFPPLSLLTYTTTSNNPRVSNGVVSGLLPNSYTSNPAAFGNYGITLAGTSYFAFAQSDNKDEDEWYRNYPRAQMSEGEQQAVSGLVSNTFGVLKAASKIPMLSSLVAPLSWVSRIGSIVSAGYSKPTDVAKPNPFYNIPAKGFTHGEDFDGSVSLGVIPDNSIGVEPGIFSSSIDELNIPFIAKKSCYLRTDSWTTTSTGKIFSVFVSPGIATIVGQAYQPTLLAYLASMFKFWHGGLRYRISVAKTGFHTGRLRISYHPAALTTGATYPADNAYSWILDLSVSSEIDIEIPYVSTKPWLISDLFDQNNSNPYGPSTAISAVVGSNNLNFCTGVLQIEVLNQLRAAGQASNTVEILTWISASDDIEFSVPNFSSFRPCSSALTFEQPRFIRSKREAVEEIEEPELEEEQIENEILYRIKRELEESDEDILSEEIGENVTENDDDDSNEDLEIEAQAFQNITDASMHLGQLDGTEFTRIFGAPNAFGNSHMLTMGEKIDNLRVLIKRFTPIAYKAGTANSITPSTVVFDPAYFGTLAPQSSVYDVPINLYSGSTVVGSYTNTLSPIEYISKIYRFYRGSRRYKAVLGNGSTGDSTIMNFAVQGYLGAQVRVNGAVNPPRILLSTEPPNVSFDTSGRFAHFVDGVNNKICEVSAPFFSSTPIQVISNGTTLPQADDYCMRFFVYFNSLANASNQSKPMVFYQAAGDDFNFGYLIGAPLLKRIAPVALFD